MKMYPSLSNPLYFTIFLSSIIFGCSPFRKGNELTKFKTFQYSYQNIDQSKSFAILFTQSDTFFLKKDLLNNYDTISYSLLSFTERQKLNSLISPIFSSTQDSLNDLKDRPEGFYFDLTFSNETQYIFCQSYHPPLPIVEFTDFINSLRNHENFAPINTVIQFKKQNDLFLFKDIIKNGR